MPPKRVNLTAGRRRKKPEPGESDAAPRASLEVTDDIDWVASASAEIPKKPKLQAPEEDSSRWSELYQDRRQEAAQDGDDQFYEAAPAVSNPEEEERGIKESLAKLSEQNARIMARRQAEAAKASAAEAEKPTDGSDSGSGIAYEIPEELARQLLGKTEESEDELSEDSDHELLQQLHGGAHAQTARSGAFAASTAGASVAPAVPQMIAISSDDESDAQSGDESIELSDVEEDIPLKDLPPSAQRAMQTLIRSKQAMLWNKRSAENFEDEAAEDSDSPPPSPRAQSAAARRPMPSMLARSSAQDEPVPYRPASISPASYSSSASSTRRSASSSSSSARPEPPEDRPVQHAVVMCVIAGENWTTKVKLRKDLPLMNPAVLSKLAKFVRAKFGTEIRQLYYRGRPLTDTETPADLGLVDDDLVHAMPE